MDRVNVGSSNIRSIGYENNVLEVEFLNNSIYQYYNVEIYHFDNLITKPHPGTYFSKFIKDKYLFIRVF